MQVLLSVVFTNGPGTHRKSRCCLSAWLPLWNYHWHKAPIALCPGAGTTEAGGEEKDSGGRASRAPREESRWLQPAGMWPYKLELWNWQLGLVPFLSPRAKLWRTTLPKTVYAEVTSVNAERLLNLARRRHVCVRCVLKRHARNVCDLRYLTSCVDLKYLTSCLLRGGLSPGTSTRRAPRCRIPVLPAQPSSILLQWRPAATNEHSSSLFPSFQISAISP